MMAGFMQGNQLNNPYAGLMNNAATKQRLAEILMANGARGFDSPSHPMGQNSWGQVAAQVLNGVGGVYLQNKANQDMNAIQSRIGQDTGVAMEDLLAGLKENPDAAIARGLQSQLPGVAKAAKFFSDTRKADLNAARGAATNDSVINGVRSGGNIMDFLAPKVETSTVSPGSHIINDQTGEIINPTFQPGAETRTRMIDGNLYQETATGMDQINKAPQIRNSTTVNNIPAQTESEYAKAFGRGQGKMASDFLQNRDSMISAVESANRGLELLDKGIHSGLLAPLAKGVDKASIALFKTDPTKAQNTEEFISTVAPQVLNALQILGGNDSNEDRKYLQGVMGGDIQAELGTLKAIVSRTRDKLNRSLQSGDKAIQHGVDRGFITPTVREGTMPQPGQDYKGQQDMNTPMDLSDYIKANRR